MSQYDHLPEIARQLITLVGYDNTLILMREFGGTYLDVPKDPARASILQELLPYPAVVALCEYYNDSRISYIPKLDAALRKARDDEIRQQYGKVCLRNLARQHKLTISRIYQILADQDKDRQTSLF